MGVFVKGVEIVEDPSCAGAEVHLKFLLRTVEHELLFLSSQVAVRNMDPNPGLLCDVGHEVAAGKVPGCHSTVRKAKVLIPNQLTLIDLTNNSRSLTLLTGTSGVEGKVLSTEGRKLGTTGWTGNHPHLVARFAHRFCNRQTRLNLVTVGTAG